MLSWCPAAARSAVAESGPATVLGSEGLQQSLTAVTPSLTDATPPPSIILLTLPSPHACSYVVSVADAKRLHGDNEQLSISNWRQS